MYWGILGIGLILFLPPVLAGCLSVLFLRLASNYYQVDIRRPLLEIGVVFGISLYLYSVSFLIVSPVGGSIGGHIASNVVTTVLLTIHLNGAFAITHLTPEIPILRSRPELAMAMAGVKGVTAIAVGVHVLIV